LRGAARPHEIDSISLFSAIVKKPTQSGRRQKLCKNYWRILQFADLRAHKRHILYAVARFIGRYQQKLAGKIKALMRKRKCARIVLIIKDWSWEDARLFLLIIGHGEGHGGVPPVLPCFAVPAQESRCSCHLHRYSSGLPTFRMGLSLCICEPQD
jgi:hypothetical protein